MSIAPGSVWIGDNEKIEGSTDEPGSIAVFDQDLYLGQEESWAPGEKVGSVHGVFVLSPDKKRALTTITLEFDDEDKSMLVAAGSLPFGSSIGNGVLAVTGRTGKLGNAHARLRVEVKNPKKYSNQP